MEPPPLPTQPGRFRLRVQILPPSDAYNLSAVPLRQFTIVKTSALALPDLSLQQLCEEVVKRFKAIYPGESLFAIEKPQDSYGSDLYLGDHVRDIFEDNEIFRVIKGATIRVSVEPHRARSQSVQPAGFIPYGSATSGKRSHGISGLEDSLRGHKRQRIISYDPDRPIRSSERDTVDREVQPEQEYAETVLIQNSQDSASQVTNGVSQGSLNYQPSAPSQAPDGVSVNLQHANVTTKSSATQRRNTLIANNGREVAASSGSDSGPPRRRFASQTKRKLIFPGDFSEQERGQSTSTAVTTPVSVLQQTSHQSPVDDSRKLRRPTIRPATNKTGDQQGKRLPPRQNIYEDIETDSEHYALKPTSNDISSTLINSYKWRKSTLKSKPGSEKSSSPLRGNSSVRDKNTGISVGRETDGEQTSERDQIRNTKLAKRQAEQERSRLTFEAEKQRLESKDRERVYEANLETERAIAEEHRQELKARRLTEAEARRRKDESDNSVASKIAHLTEENTSHRVTTTKLLEGRDPQANQADEVPEVNFTEARSQLSAPQKAGGESHLKEQPNVQSRPENKSKLQNLQALQATVRRAAQPPVKSLAPSTGSSAVQGIPQEILTTSKSTSSSTTTRNTQATCTPFIPRGRPLRSSLTPLPASKTTGGALPTLSPPNVGIEAQMPMPSQLKRKVSFVDQVPPSARRSSGVSSTLKQTMLVPPRLGISDVKITPKRTIFVGKSNDLKSSKGKARVMESPAKPPSPVIEISSDEESIQKPQKIRMQLESSKGVGSPGPAYHMDVATNSSSPSKSQAREDVKEADVLVDDRANPNAKVRQTSMRNSTSPPKTSTSSINIHSQINTTHSSSEGLPSRPLSLSTTTPNKNSIPKFQRRTSTRAYDSLKTTEQSRHVESLEGSPGRAWSLEENALNDDNTDHESESRENPNKPTPDISGSTSDRDDHSKNDQEDQRDLSEDVGDKEAMHNGVHNTPTVVNVTKPSKNGPEKQAHPNLDKDDAVGDGPGEDSDIDETGSEYDLADGETEELSDTMQAQVDDQLLAQSLAASSPHEQQSRFLNSGTSSSFERQSKFAKPAERLLPTSEDTGLHQIQSSGRPSLKRMNQEAQRNRLNRMNSDTQHTKKSKIEETADLSDELIEASLSESGSSSSDESAEEKSTMDFRIRGQGLMFGPTSTHQQQGPNTYGKKSKKIGWAKLEKQFSVQKRKNGG